jgi:hypothetical protein
MLKHLSALDAPITQAMSKQIGSSILVRSRSGSLRARKAEHRNRLGCRQNRGATDRTRSRRQQARRHMAAIKNIRGGGRKGHNRGRGMRLCRRGSEDYDARRADRREWRRPPPRHRPSRMAPTAKRRRSRSGLRIEEPPWRQEPCLAENVPRAGQARETGTRHNRSTHNSLSLRSALR